MNHTASDVNPDEAPPVSGVVNGEEEVGRFQANIMMQMEATKKEIQGKIDEIIMESF